jgi:hypothetical protein
MFYTPNLVKKIKYILLVEQMPQLMPPCCGFMSFSFEGRVQHQVGDSEDKAGTCDWELKQKDTIDRFNR